MPPNGNHEAHDYAERIRARLAHGVGMTLPEFVEWLEQSSPALQRATACDASLRTNSHPFAKCGLHVLAR